MPELLRRGVRVAVVKHHGHADTSGFRKHTENLFAAGAEPAVLFGPDHIVWQERPQGDALASIFDRLTHCDLILFAGFKCAVKNPTNRFAVQPGTQSGRLKWFSPFSKSSERILIISIFVVFEGRTIQQRV